MGYFSGATNQNQGKYPGSVRFYRMVNTPFELGNYLLVRQAKKVYLACRESRMTAIMGGWGLGGGHREDFQQCVSPRRFLGR